MTAENEGANETYNNPPDISEILKKFDSEKEKRLLAEAQLQEVVDELLKKVPEEYIEIVPDLPTGTLINWLRQATSKGIFKNITVEPIDPKRPNDQKLVDLSNINPTELIERGLNKLLK